jgi:hypothetical protein
MAGAAKKVTQVSQGVSSTSALQSHAMRVIAKANLVIRIECGDKSKGAAPHRLKKEAFAAIEQWLQVAVDLKICAVPSNTYNRSKNSELCQIMLFKISKSTMLLSAKDLIENLTLSIKI